MKSKAFLNLLTLSLVLVAGVTGCKKKPTGITPIHGPASGGLRGGDPSKQIENVPGIDPNEVIKNADGTIPLGGPKAWLNNPQDPKILEAQTVYFDVDSATVKSSEKSKLEAVADHLKKNANHNLIIGGHCDERGTEGYNLSLGDRRAQALREYLVQLGISPDHIEPMSYGEGKPAASGHDESAWSKNRRGEFIVVLPAL